MNARFENVRKAFRDECDRTGRAPNLTNFIGSIRATFPLNKPVYVVIYEYITSSGSDRDAELLTEAEINWPGLKNDKTWRDIYFHVSKQDPNIWILRNEFRGNSHILSAILVESAREKFW